MKKLWIKIAAWCGYFFCPMCEKFSRRQQKYLIGGHLVCNPCASKAINENIKSWYGDWK